MKSFIAFAASLLMLTGCASMMMSPKSSSASAPPPPPPAGPNISGSWALTVESPIGNNESTATFQQSGGTLSGTIANEQGEAALTGTIEDAAVTFSITIDVQGQTLKLDYSGQITDDAMSGTVKFGDFGAGTWSGKRKS